MHRLAEMHLEQIGALKARISALDGELRAASRASAEATRLQTMPGVGPVTAMAIEAFAPEMTAFRNGRGFAASLG
ncbi:MAG: transposase, partial [Pseudomonadota bacterium]